MDEEKINRKLTAIVSADVAGYSRLMRDDEVATVNTLSEYRELMSNLILQHQGRVVDNPGDNLLAEFSSVVDAVQSAVAIQKELKVRNAKLSDARKMEFRIGINIGDVIQEDDRIYGDGVNIAARLEGLAEPGGICISRTAYDQIESKLPFGYEYLGQQTVKNINKPLYAYRVILEPEISDSENRTDIESASNSHHMQFEDTGGEEEKGQTFRHVKDSVHVFAKEMAKDEQLGKTYKEIKDKVLDIKEEFAGDPERREKAVHKLIRNRHVQIFFGFGVILLIINGLTSFGNWWFQYPLISIGLLVYLNWLRDTFLSSDKLRDMRQNIFESEITRLPQGVQPTDEEKERLKRLVAAKVSFYRHVYLYLGVNVFLLLLNLITSPLSWWFQFPLLGWGCLLFLHWMKNNMRQPNK